MDYKEKMSTILLDLRTKKGVTQEDAAANLGVSNKTVSKWETGYSMPETEYLPVIADYYDVSIGELFGMESSSKSVRSFIAQQFEGLSKWDTVVKSFRLAHDVVRSCINQMGMNESAVNQGSNDLFGYGEYFNRSLISCNDVFGLLLNSKHANMVVMLGGNEDDFAWLTDKADSYIPLIKFLADAGAIKLFQLMHSQKFPLEFTVDYIAKAVEIDEQRVEELLDEAVKLDICMVQEMDLKDGLTKLYNAQGNGYILSALTLIHEHACGKKHHHHANCSSVKLIRGGDGS